METMEMEILSEDEELDMEALILATTPDYQPEKLNVEVLKLLIARLAQLLGQEVDLLDSMNVRGLAALQPEKMALVDALEKQKKLIARRQGFRAALQEEDREELRELMEIFEAVMHENHNRLLVAREVNRHVVEAITELAQENARQSFYTRTGERAGDPSMSLSLNHSI